jgi:hypothetical protein
LRKYVVNVISVTLGIAHMIFVLAVSDSERLIVKRIIFLEGEKLSIRLGD